ncbi:unnamed protein product [Sphenostylis stenocarpa]|uniref:Uncharacterized protein n=1 Tax=Sphenostylis stenocarpa TaxID=92480 RepID=A0AA86VQP2_9FABA|nr:unnamed protein product [Sphenostylis stenocarpa]
MEEHNTNVHIRKQHGNQVVAEDWLVKLPINCMGPYQLVQQKRVKEVNSPSDDRSKNVGIHNRSTVYAEKKISELGLKARKFI